MSGTRELFRAHLSISLVHYRPIGVLVLALLTAVLVGAVQAGDEPTSGSVGPAAASWTAASLDDDPLGFEDRVRYQRAIEEVYWHNRIWPAENPTPKPALDEAIPDDLIRDRVATYLLKSVALELFWSRPLTGEKLQAELDRLVRDTRHPELLRELFAALDDDPFVIAECLARPELVNRLTRNWYARDDRFHGVLRKQAEAALVAYSGEAARLREFGGEYRETEFRLVTQTPRAADLETIQEGHRITGLTGGEWRGWIEHLAARFGIEPESEKTGSPSALLDQLPVNRVSRIVEENDRFAVTVLLSKEPDRLHAATATWRKRNFDEWWSEFGRTAVEGYDGSSRVLPPIGGYRAQAPLEGGCAPDTWAGRDDIPEGRFFHTAVWTGAEMIIWGGRRNYYLATGSRYFPATDSWKMTSTGPDAPSPRYHHTAVWTGTEMVVWGGQFSDPSGGVPYNTGGRYDPVTDSWKPTSIGPGVPSPRNYHTALWTGTEMLVWGGSSVETGYVNTGGRYDPVTDSWTGTSTEPGVPTPRNRHTALWTGTEMIVWGGWSPMVNTGGRYDPTTDSWTETSTGPGVPSARIGHTAVWTGTEMIIWGGWDTNDGGRYDPVSDSWTPTSTGPGVPTPREHHVAVWTGDEMIVWGGQSGSPRLEYNDGGRYDPASDSWTAMPGEAGAPYKRIAHTAVWTGSEMIVWGGWSRYDGNWLYHETGGRYDPLADNWMPTATDTLAPEERSGHRAVWTGSEMLVWGGYNADGKPDSGGRYDPATNAWSPISIGPDAPNGRSGPAVVWTGSEMIVWSGERYEGGFVHPNSGGRYNPASDAWTATSTGPGVPEGRRYAAAVWTGSEMIVWGGFDGGYLNSGGRYDPETDSWSATSTGTGVPVGRHFHTGVWTGSEMITWGGYDGARPLDTGGRYDPVNDAWTATSVGAGVPEARQIHTGIWTGSEMIVWGGRGTAYLNSGGRYDPATDNWTPTSEAAEVPQGRYFHSAIWTGTEMIVWGGSRFDIGWVFLHSGGRYDPATNSWAETSEAFGHPEARNGHSAIWTGTEMVVWGGYDGDEHLRNSGRYCDCGDSRSVTTWYPDMDEDGHGADSTGIQSCSQPPGYIDHAGDCDDTNSDTHAGAAEVNDGLDNQCPGDAGFGLTDEIGGRSGFQNPADGDEFSWIAQGAATSYQVARSTDPHFATGCTLTVTTSTLWIDNDQVPPSTCHHYLVRAWAPNVGSWGMDTAGVARQGVCP